MATTMGSTGITVGSALTGGGGSAAPSYFVRAWAYFNGTGANAANATVPDSFNTSSVYKTTTGQYTINFATAAPSAYYGVFSSDAQGSSGYYILSWCPVDYNTGLQGRTASGIKGQYNACNGGAQNTYYGCLTAIW